MSGRVIALARGRSLVLDGPAIVMGIVNTSPDSFYAASRMSGFDPETMDAIAGMVDAGAAIIDVGGESTRPGSEYVSADEELTRVLPLVEGIRSRWDIAISVDTRKASVAQAALDSGADIINDVSALSDDPRLAPLCASRAVPVVLMHKKGIPSSMQDAPWYEYCVKEVLAYLLAAAERAMQAGIARDAIVLDPGIGFGKRIEDNLALLARLDEISGSGYPVLVGVSRKSFIGTLCGAGTEARLPGSLAAACAARAGGASIFRVHDVAETVQALSVFDAVYRRQGSPVP